MRKRKKEFAELKEKDYAAETLFKQLTEASKGIYYMSETDAQITPFIGGASNEVSKEEIIRLTGIAPDEQIEERDFAEVFERLTIIQDWFGEDETKTVAKYSELRRLLEENLKDLKVFKIGKIELDIYFVGLNQAGILMGVKTKAVET